MASKREEEWKAWTQDPENIKKYPDVVTLGMKEGEKALAHKYNTRWGKTDEDVAEANDPFLKSQKTGMAMSAASTPNMNDATDHSIQYDTPLTSVRNDDGNIATSREEAVTETPESVQEKIALETTLPPAVTPPAPTVSGTNDTVDEAKKDPVSRYKMRSILDAYNAGEIDKDSRDYLIIDTLSNFARNLGKDMGNVAAAYSGGTVDNERGTSLWDKRNAAMAQSAIEGEQTGVEGSREKRAADQQAANLAITHINKLNMEQRRELAEKVKEMAEDAPDALKVAAYSLANNMLTGQTMSMYDIAGTGLTSLLSKLIPIPGI